MISGWNIGWSIFWICFFSFYGFKAWANRPQFCPKCHGLLEKVKVPGVDDEDDEA